MPCPCNILARVVNNPMMTVKNILLVLVAGVLSCKPANEITEITGSWKNPEVTPRSMKTILVMTINGSKEAREKIENDLSRALQQHGYQTIQGLEVLPSGVTSVTQEDRAIVLDKIEEREVDGILTVALLNEHTEDRYVPGADRYDPVPRFGYTPRFWGYYSDLYPVLNTPGYYQEDKVYFLETNVYDAHTEDLLWSAQSHTYSPDNLSSVTKDFATVLISRMEKDGIIASD